MINLSISLIIPAYNEERYLSSCLEAIAVQSVKPYEVIVVDNNSSDSTNLVASKYPFVKVIKEASQGVIHARSTGFDAASGDIIARIDADTLLPIDWIANLQSIFMEDSELDALSGAVSYYDLPYTKLASRIDLFFRQSIANRMGDEVFLYGANMAIRRKSWLKAKPLLCNSGGLHEDFDLAIHAQETGAKVVFDRRLKASVSLRRLDVSWPHFLQYAMLNPKTYAVHGKTSQRNMYGALALALSFFWFIKLLHRSYDTKTLKYSWLKLFSSAESRPNPATFVD